MLQNAPGNGGFLDPFRLGFLGHRKGLLPWLSATDVPRASGSDEASGALLVDVVGANSFGKMVVSKFSNKWIQIKDTQMIQNENKPQG